MQISLRTVIINEINNVIIALRTNSRFSNRGRFQFEVLRSVENKLLVEMKNLRDIVFANFESTKILTILKPFFAIIESEETTGPITGVALMSIKKFINYPIIDKNNLNSRVVIREIVKSLKRCQFEVTDISTDESTLITILEVFFCCIQLGEGNLLTEQIVFDIFKSCFRIGRETRPSENLRRSCEKYLESICEIIFKRVLKRDSKAEMCSVFKFICKLCDPSKEGKTGLLKLLGLTLANTVLEIFGKQLSDFQNLHKICSNELCRALLKNCDTTNIVIFSQTLRGISNCMLILNNIHEQVESFFFSCHFRILNITHGINYELKELVLENLMYLFSNEDFALELYHKYDCYFQSSNLLENTIKVLCKTIKQKNGGLNCIHTLSLQVLLQIVECIQKRTNGNHLFNKKKSMENSEFQKYRSEKTTKYQVMELCESINKDIKIGFVKLKKTSKFITSEENTNKEIAEFLFNYSRWLDKIVIGNILKDVKNENILFEYIGLFNFKNLRVDEAIRFVICKFHLHGEGQQVARMLETISHFYFLANEDSYFENEDTVFRFATWVMMLHADCHSNKTNHRGISLATFIKQGKEIFITDNKTKPIIEEEELELIYNEIETNEIQLFQTASDDFVSDSNWGVLLNKSEEYKNLKKELINDLVYDCDLFENIWATIGNSIKIVFDKSKDNYTINMAIEGFKISSKIAHFYQLSNVVDKIIISLSEFTKILKPNTDKSTFYISSFGSNSKFMLATKTIFLITKNYGNTLRKGWEIVLDLIIRIYELGLLLFKDPFWSTENVFYEKRSLEIKKKYYSNGATSWFGFWNSSDDNVSEKESIEEAKNCIENCRIIDLLNDVKYLESDSLLCLIKGFILNSQKTKLIYTLTFCLKLLIEICISKKDSILRFWKHISEHIENLVNTIKKNYKQNNKISKSGLILFQNVINSVFQLYMKLMDSENEEFIKKLEKFFLILKMEEDVLKNVFKGSIAYCYDLINNNGKKIKNYQIWEILLGILQLKDPKLIATSRDCLRNLIRDNLFIFPENLNTLLNTVFILFENEIELFDYVIIFNNRIFQHKDFLEDSWFLLLNGLSNISISKEKSIRNLSVNNLQRFLLNPVTLNLNQNVIQKNFQVLFNLLDKLIKSNFREIRLKVTGLLSKTFLHFVSKMNKDKMEILWMQIVDYMKKLVAINCEFLIESTPQILKNMILVMKSQQILVGDFWETTKQRLSDCRLLQKIINEIEIFLAVEEEKKRIESEKKENENKIEKKEVILQNDDKNENMEGEEKVEEVEKDDEEKRVKEETKNSDKENVK